MTNKTKQTDYINTTDIEQSISNAIISNQDKKKQELRQINKELLLMVMSKHYTTNRLNIKMREQLNNNLISSFNVNTASQLIEECDQ